MKSRGIGLIVLVACFAVQARSQGDEQVAKVRSALDRGEPYKAIRKCEHFLKADGPRSALLVLRAEGYNAIGEYRKALRDAQQAMNFPAEVDRSAAEQAGIAYHGLALWDSAALMLGRALGDADDSNAHFYLALTAAAQHRCEEAITEFGKVLETAPGLYKAYRERGACFAQAGDSAAARRDLDKAIELAPRDPVNWNSRGYYGYASFGDHARALADYDRAIKLNPNYGYAFNNRGWSRFKLGDKERALRDIKLAGRKSKSNPYVHRNLGMIALDSGDKKAACAHFSQALAEGFSARHGSEVEELMKINCSGSPKPAEGTVTPAPSDPPGRAPAKSNAP